MARIMTKNFVDMFTKRGIISLVEYKANMGLENAPIQSKLDNSLVKILPY